ncbi:LodA/GoxA family CTQ-dependent oxidase [soil metagenome]
MQRRYRIHPAIGIARVGDSPDEYFIGPEVPGVPPSLGKPDALPSPNSTYKDQKGRIKRQGARFRIYEYTLDDAGAPTKIREITTSNAQIEWRVNLANRKAAAPEFPKGQKRRNNKVPENKLIIDAGLQKISGAGQNLKRLQGRFMDAIDVPLGDLLTDGAGRLIVLGGFGKSQSPSGNKLGNYANNDGWCDDTSDGPVQASIKLKGATETIEADPAWVIVAPPDFAPPIENVVTLFDVVFNMMAKFDPSLAISDATKVSFTKDIYPILRRASNMPWVSLDAAGGHQPGSFGHFISHLKRLSSNKSDDLPVRQMVFRKLRNPKGGGGTMPKLPTNTDTKIPGVSLTEVQYKRMERWANGKFEADWKGKEPAPRSLDKLADKSDKYHPLDRAALEACTGGGFFPGIEVGQMMLKETTYDKKRPFRINAQHLPGELTAMMAVPWQADFLACAFDDDLNMDWWPGQRPNQVFRGQKQDEWVPPGWHFSDMVEKWSQLGFVVKEESTDRYVEDERSPDVK